MIHFFRRIRQGLINRERVGKYLLYAIGEILLVVIGILIALQVNTANELRKERQLELTLLEGLRSDLMADLDQIDGRVNESHRDLQLTIARFDSAVNAEELNLNYLDSIFFRRCIRPRNTFFPSDGTYKTILNTGTSNIISNRDLFKRIQVLYDLHYTGRISAAERLDVFNDQWMHEMNKSKALGDDERIDFFRDPATINELNFWMDKNEHYNINVNGMARNWRASITEVIGTIDQELGL
jgi:hypothetical protein